MRHLKKIAPIAAVIIVVATIGAILKPKAASSITHPQNSLTIHVQPLIPQDVEITSQYVGYVTPIHAVELTPNVSGYIDEIWAVGGQTVKQGDNLVMIDQRQYKAQLEAAKAAVTKAQADFNNAESYYHRLQKAGKRAISASDLDDAKAKYLAAKAALSQAKAEKQKAKVLYDYTILQSPIDGVIGNVALTKGNYTAPNGTPLLSIVQFDPIRVMFALSDKEYLAQRQKNPDGLLFGDEKIQIRLADNTIYEKLGHFQFADNQIDKSTDSISVFVDFENENRKLVANSYVDILLSQQLKDVFLIRQNFANITSDGVFVYVLNDGKLKRVPLDVVGYYQDFYVVKNKFEKEDFLVVDRIGTIPQGTTLSMKIENITEKK